MKAIRPLGYDLRGVKGAAVAPRSGTSSLPALAANAPPAHLLNASRPCRCFSLPAVSFRIVYEKKCRKSVSPWNGTAFVPKHPASFAGR